MRSCLYAFVFLLCSLIQAQTLRTDFGVYTEPALPAIGAAGSKVVDPTFGTTILRVTDAGNAPETENDVKGAIVGYSYWPTLNCNNTRLQAIVASPYSRAKIFNFDTTSFQASGGSFLPNPPAGLQEYSLMWSQTNPDLTYGVGQYNLYEINVATGASSTLRNFSPEGHSGGYVTQPSMSHDANIFAMSFAGGSGSGYVCWRRSDNTILKKVTSGLNLDEVQVDKSGRYLIIVFNDGNDEVWDLSTSPATLIGTPTQNAGTGFWHRDCGHGTMFSAYGSAGLGYRNLATPNTVTQLIPGYWSYNTQQDHFSMRADNDGWALNGRYSISGGGVINAFDNEIMQVATDGSDRVRRICHHRSIYNDYHDATFANISKDGRFVCFSSNWGNANGRHDLYVVKIPPAPEDQPSGRFDLLPALWREMSPAAFFFGSSSSITFTLTSPSRVEFNLFDIGGKLVDQIADRDFSNGTHAVTFPVRNYPTAVRFLEIRCNGKGSVRRIYVTR